ncbi:MAG TPA: DUF2142 domain-containing protein, partial [Terracidiphilus sp.]|nr:DUF2142 domain-containing protein [Terracidiphilus sp.]
RLAALTLISVTVAITLAWWIAVILASRGISHPYMAGGNVDPKMQVANLLHHPQILGALWGYFVSHISYYIAAVIGLLGWLDTPMPGPYYLAMILVLLAAMFAEFARGSVNPRRGAAIIFSAAFIGIVGVFFIEYLLFTPVGGTDLNGTQGRHLLPLLIAAAAGVPSISASEKSYKRVTALVVAAQLITVFVLPQVIMARYYGG